MVSPLLRETSFAAIGSHRQGLVTRYCHQSRWGGEEGGEGTQNAGATKIVEIFRGGEEGGGEVTCIVQYCTFEHYFIYLLSNLVFFLICSFNFDFLILLLMYLFTFHLPIYNSYI